MTIKGESNDSSASHILQQLKLYIFLSASAVNLFLAVVIIANDLQIRYFLYTAPMIVQINLLPDVWTTLLWIGSFYAVYITKEAIGEIPSFHRINHLLNAALVGSFFLIISVILESAGSIPQSSTKLLFDLLSSLTLYTGLVLSFAGSFLALFTIMAQARGLARLLVIYVVSLLLPIEILSLMHWVAYPIDVVSNFGFAWYGAFLELQLFYVAYPLILWLLTAFLFSWIWIPLLNRVKKTITAQRLAGLSGLSRVSSGSSVASNRATTEESPRRINAASSKSSVGRFLPAIVLLSSLILGVFIAYYPYISQKPGLVGTDSLGYYYTLTAIEGKGPFEAIWIASKINGARVLYHMMLFAFWSVTHLPAITIVELMPIITIVAGALAVFWFVKTAEKNTLLASIAAIFSIFSFATIISMHAGTLANWLAIALGFLMFGLILKLQEEKKLKLLLAAVLALAVVFLVHFWSGLFFVAVLGCYLFLAFWEHAKLKVRLLALVTILALVILATSLASSVTSQLVAQLVAKYDISTGFAESSNLPAAMVAFWTRLPVLIDSWFMGALANPVMILLAIVGMAVCFSQKNNFGRLLASWIIVGSVLSILVSPLGERANQWLMWRTLYLIPVQIPAALGIFFILSRLNTMGHDTGAGQMVGRDYRPALSFRLRESQTFSIVLYLAIDYIVSAFLALSFPILLSIVVFNFLLLSIVFHFKIRGRHVESITIFVFVLFVILVLFNYTLRSLAPLAINRWTP